uniref:Uncharacterized protein n=1 Tax=Timema monikensis TaxID=170555 RepID=A0A7R9HTS0_9NEOP|nr:unnamed protein product [Timema monikensis]
MLMEKAKVDPFRESCTIEGAAMLVYRQSHLKENTVVIIPNGPISTSPLLRGGACMQAAKSNAGASCDLSLASSPYGSHIVFASVIARSIQSGMDLALFVNRATSSGEHGFVTLLLAMVIRYDMKNRHTPLRSYLFFPVAKCGYISRPVTGGGVTVFTGPASYNRNDQKDDMNRIPYKTSHNTYSRRSRGCHLMQNTGITNIFPSASVDSLSTSTSHTLLESQMWKETNDFDPEKFRQVNRKVKEDYNKQAATPDDISSLPDLRKGTMPSLVSPTPMLDYNISEENILNSIEEEYALNKNSFLSLSQK